MKKVLTVMLLLIMAATTAFSGNANQEFRATWSITWHQFWSGATVDQLKARTIEILDNHVAANMNAVLWHVRQGGTVYYPSAYEPWGSYIGGADPGYDPLAFAVEEAHKRGLEIHAWFNVFQVSSTVPGTIAAEHPDWICRDEDGNVMTESRSSSPGMAAVREHTLKVAMEVVNNYDIDGLHFDYVRWNEYSSSKSSRNLARQAEEDGRMDGQWTDEEIEILMSSKAGRYLYDVEHPKSGGVPAGYATWAAYWRDSVTKFVAAVHDSVAQVKPWVRVSAAALGKHGYPLNDSTPSLDWDGEHVYQDAVGWFNAGHVDQLTPMHYHWTNADGFEDMLTGWNGWEDYIGTGIAAKRLYSVGPGSYVLDGANVWGNHPSIVNRLRTIKWVDGEQFFSYGDWKAHLYWEEAGQTFYSRKTKIRNIPVISKAAPAAPSLAISKLSDAAYTLTVTPVSGTDTGQWFVLYRQGNSDISPDTSLIEDVFFADSSFTVDLAFDGLQNYSGTQYYKVSMADRFWTESELSTAVNTDAIPSIPPRVLSTTPSQGQLVPLESDLTLTFNKSMNQTALESYLRIEPDIDMTFSWENDGWADGDKAVTLKFSEPLAYGTHYIITLDQNVTDRAGNSMDGNGDGVSGDNCILNLTTVNIDLEAPVITGTHPEIQDFANFDQDDVLNVRFSEFMDHATLNSTSVVLSSGGTAIPAGIFAFDGPDYTVLNVKPQAPFEAGTNFTLQVTTDAADTTGNALTEANTLNVSVTSNAYSGIADIDPLTAANGWWDPEGSGSTTGTVGAETVFGYSSTVYVPGTGRTKSAYIRYSWANAGGGLLRAHNAGTPAGMEILPSQVVQVYVYGDGSNNEFAFSFYEKDASGSNTGDVIEVSKWIKLSWTGWRLISWDLRDPEQVGDFISAGENINGAAYKLDGLLLRQVSWAAKTGTVYFSGLRVADRTETVTNYTGIEQPAAVTETSFSLKPNYPNPFNPVTRIDFEISESAPTRLDIYDLRGRLVMTPVNNTLAAGTYSYTVDLSGNASGVYICRLISGARSESRRMLFLK